MELISGVFIWGVVGGVPPKESLMPGDLKF